MEQYFSNQPTSKSKEESYEAVVQGHKFTFTTDHGVFSKKGLDYGTRSLLEKIPFERLQGTVLDFGCGYGPIGIIVKILANVKVDMVDINERSLKLAFKNADRNHADVTIFKSDVYAGVAKTYDYIITNPPIRVGKTILYQILKEARLHLEDQGELWFVIHKDQGAKTLLRDMEGDYQMEIVDKNKGFYIICARKN